MFISPKHMVCFGMTHSPVFSSLRANTAPVLIQNRSLITPFPGQVSVLFQPAKKVVETFGHRGMGKYGVKQGAGGQSTLHRHLDNRHHLATMGSQDRYTQDQPGFRVHHSLQEATGFTHGDCPGDGSNWQWGNPGGESLRSCPFPPGPHDGRQQIV